VLDVGFLNVRLGERLGVVRSRAPQLHMITFFAPPALRIRHRRRRALAYLPHKTHIMSTPKPSAADLIKDYYAQKIDIVSRIPENKTAPEQPDSLKLDAQRLSTSTSNPPNEAETSHQT